MRTRVYISGPVTGTTDYYERFLETEKQLESVGFSVLNPIKVQSQMPKDSQYADYMKVSMCLLELCDAIFMMDGWENSHGAKAEFYYARSLGLDYLYKGEDGNFHTMV